MNSLRRPHHFRLHDLRNFLHIYDPASDIKPADWANKTTKDFNEGYLLFLLEPIGLPFSIASLAQKEEDENFRVTELGIVLRTEDNKPLMIAVSSNSYELRFLPTLIEEKAKKALLDHKKSYFVAAKPASLSNAAINKLNGLSHLYAQGGSRRDFTNDKEHFWQEPLVASLVACDVRLSLDDWGKQPVDLGYICHLFFSSDPRQQDNNHNQLKAKFALIPRHPIEEPEQAKTQPPPAVTNSLKDTGAFNVLSSWGEGPNLDQLPAGASLFKRLTNELEKRKLPQNEVSSASKQLSEPVSIDTTVAAQANQNNTIAQSNIGSTVASDKVYHHISEAISGLLDAETPAANVAQEQSEKSVAVSQLPLGESVSPEPTSSESGSALAEPMPTDPVSAESVSIEPLSAEPESTAPKDFALLDNVTTENTSMAFPELAKLDDFQEPKVVITEMASLMNKVESQVARAAKKLTNRTSNIEQMLGSTLSGILASVIQEDKDIEAELVVSSNALSKQFESLFENLKAEIAERAASAREQIQGKLAGQQKLIEEREQEHRETLVTALDQNKSQFAQLIETQESQLQKLIKEEAQKIESRLTGIQTLLQAITDKYIENLSSKLKEFEKRIGEEMAVILSSLDNNTEMLIHNTDITCNHSLEKLETIKDEFEISLKRLIESTEISLARQIKVAQIEYFLPRLKEHKQLLESIMQNMEQTFTEKLLDQANTQLEGLKTSLASARAQLKGLMSECLTKLDLIGRNQQSGLEELFSAAANSLVRDKDNLLKMLAVAEKETVDSDALCKKLAETYSLDTDPAVTNLRQNIYNKVDSLKAQVKTDLESVVNNDCASLEELVRNQHTNLNTKRAELARKVHFTSDNGLQRIRAAIHDAFNAIQSEREKYME